MQRIVLQKTTPFPGEFLHGIDLSDFYRCWNLSLSGYLTSAEFNSWNNVYLFPPVSVRTASLADLKQLYITLGAVIPRASWYVACAAIVRAGGHVGIGVNNTRWLSATQMDRLLKIGDIEIAFEETRRSVMPDAACRLCCLWVTDSNTAGEDHIRNMLGPNTYIIHVAIPEQIRVTKADTRWFDAYYQDPQPDYIEHYWRSEAFDADTRSWEYLVEGKIQITDPAQLAHVQQHGGHNALMQVPATH
jgi:hypothetical protein